MEKGKERTKEGYTSVDFSILSLTLAYIKSSLGSIKASFFKFFFLAMRKLLNDKKMVLPQINQIYKVLQSSHNFFRLLN